MILNILAAAFYALEIEGKLEIETPEPIAPTKMTYTPVNTSL